MSELIEFEPVGRRGECSHEQSLLDAARHLGVDLVSLCGGLGNCEHCRVQVVSGRVTQLTHEEEAILTREEIKRGFRLACQTYPLSNVKLYVPPESLSAPQRTQVEGLDVTLQPEPVIRVYEIEIQAPSLDAPLADDDRVWSALREQHGISAGRIDLNLIRSLPRQLRDLDWHVSIAMRGDEAIAASGQATRWLGLAVDIGTTKLAGYLVDLGNGKTLASQGRMNPQISLGEDIITRIAAAEQSEANAEQLINSLRKSITELAEELCADAGCAIEQIADVVVVGNTAMHHLFLGLPVGQLGRAPYVAAMRSAVDIKARELGLSFVPGAYVHVLPNIAGFIGADHTAMLLASGIMQAEGVVLAIDIGTNTEICLKAKNHLTSVSCASGPAFEGAHIKFGMRAGVGAIEHARFDHGQLEYQTIGGARPVGICGSGLLDIVAQLRSQGIIDRSGRIKDNIRVRGQDNGREYVIISEAEREGLEALCLTQKDVRELQLAKAAIRVGIQALAESKGINETEIEQLIIAGAFGSYIDIASAITIGMLPDLPLKRFKQIGNAAGTGARLALVSRMKRLEAQRLVQQVGYIELAILPNFQNKYMEVMQLK